MRSTCGNSAPLILARYDRDASRYHKGVYTRKRADLTAALDSTLSTLFLGQLKNLHKSCLVAFKTELLNGLRGETYDFADVVSKARERCLGTFSEGAKEALVEGTDWVWTDEFESLKEEVRSVADQCRKDETKKMLNLIEVFFFAMGVSPLAHLIFELAKFQETYLGTCGTGSQQGFSRDVG
jgi:hypothetical protein